MEIGGRKYPVVNIGSRGLGIQLPNDSAFTPGEELPEIIFNFRDRQTTLKGRVVHVSMEDEQVYLCGISLVTMSEKQEKLLLGIVQQRRQSMFGRE